MSDGGKPRIAGRYQLLRTLGAGGMGEVCLADDLQLGRKVALKALRRDRIGDPTAVKRFRQEALAMARVRHPNVLRILDVLDHGGHSYIVMEYVDGVELARMILAQGRLGVPFVTRLGTQVAAALAALHAEGVVHRDLTSRNILVRRGDESAVVMDLGLARMVDRTRLTATDVLVGTPRYMAPETIRAGIWTPRSDQYQLGAVLFEALTGRRLVPGETIDELCDNIAAGVQNRFPDQAPPVPWGLRRIVQRAVSRDPALRFPDMTAMAEALERAEVRSGGDELAARETAELCPPPAPASTPRARVLPLILMLAAGVSLLTMSPVLSPPSGPQDIRWEVIGDALRVDFRAGRHEEVRLLVGEEVVEHRAGPEGSDPSLVFRGLGQSEVRCRLAWGGEESPAVWMRAQEPAVGEKVSLGEGRRLVVRVRRPCAVGWKGPGASARLLQPGEHGLAAPDEPENSRMVLTWRERGLGFEREVRWPRLAGDALTRVFRELDGVEPGEVLMARFRAGKAASGENLVKERSRWMPLREWVPDLLESELPAPRRRRLLELWQAWQRSVQQERLLGDSPPDLRTTRLGSGSRFVGAPDWSGSVRVEGLEAIGGNPATFRPGFIHLLSASAGLVPKLNYASDARGARFRWPAGLPRDRRPLAVSVRVGRLHHFDALEIRPVEAGALPLVLWYPEPLEVLHRPLRDSWLTVCIPADLAPAPGTPMEIRLRPVLNPVAEICFLEQVRLAWPD